MDVAYLKNTKFSDRNATRNGAKVGDSVDSLKKIRFDLVKKQKHFDIEDEEERHFYQAEILCLRHLPIEFIININNL